MQSDSFMIRKTRGVFDVLGDTFIYIRIYWKSLLKMTALYVLGPLAAGSLLFAIGFGDIFSTGFASPEDIEQSFAYQSWSILFGAFFFMILSYILLYGVVCQHLKFAGKGDVPLDISAFSSGMFSNLLMLIFLFALIFMGLIAFFTFIPAVLFSTFSLQAGIMTIFVTMLLLFSVLLYVTIRLMVFPVALFVKESAGFESLGISWRLTRGYFWQSFGVYILITIIFGILSQLISTPLLLINVILGEGVGDAGGGIMEFIRTAFTTVSFVFQVLFFGAQSIAIGLHYFNLEERKEAHTLGDQVDRLANES